MKENVTIRKWKLEDAKALAEALSNKKILNNLRDGLPYPYTEKDALSYIQAMLEADPDSTFAYAIDIDGIAVGSIGAFRQENIHSRTAELGYYLSEQYWGKGVGRTLFEAMRKDYEKQEFTVHSSPYGVKIYEHLGFKATSEEQLVNGLRFTPMVFKNER